MKRLTQVCSNISIPYVYFTTTSHFKENYKNQRKKIQIIQPYAQ